MGVVHALDRGDEVVEVCREANVHKLDAVQGRITVVPGATDDRTVIDRAVAGCDGVLTVLVPRGVHHYSSGCTSGRTAGVPLRLPHHPRQPGRVLVEGQGAGERRRPARAALGAETALGTPPVDGIVPTQLMLTAAALPDDRATESEVDAALLRADPSSRRL